MDPRQLAALFVFLRHCCEISYIVLFLTEWLWVLCFCSILGMWLFLIMDFRKMDVLAVPVPCCSGFPYVRLLF